MDSNSISEIIKAARSVEEKLDFDNSSLKFDNPPNFGLDEYKISKISMEDTFVKSKKGKEKVKVKKKDRKKERSKSKKSDKTSKKSVKSKKSKKP